MITSWPRGEVEISFLRMKFVKDFNKRCFAENARNGNSFIASKYLNKGEAVYLSEINLRRN